MRYGALQRLLPRPIHRYLLDFETRIEDAVHKFAAALPSGARVIDAGAGESRHAGSFTEQHYTAVDLAVGDMMWNYAQLDAVADLTSLPFQPGSFDACLNVVTLEHVPEPGAVLGELARVLAPGGQLLLVAPHEWEVHQAPHDYFRYTRHGLRYLLDRVGFTEVSIVPMGGFFRLLSRRMMNGLQFFPPILLPLAALLIAPAALLLPLFDFLDREKNFTLGYVCTARKPLSSG